MSGRVTVAIHVGGERRGQRVSRRWTFAPFCAAGQCARITLTRSRAGGTDTLVLHRQSPGHYRGTGRFYAPLNCAGTLHPRGESVPFTITVRITRATRSSSGPVATSIAATYKNRSRTNLTPCVRLPSHDAAIYAGALVTTAARPAAALTSRSPAGS